MGEYIDKPELLEDQESDSNLVRDLRHQIREANKHITAITADLGTARKENRDSTIGKMLVTHGITDEKKLSKVVKLIPADIEATEKGLKSWIDEFGDVFGIGSEPAATTPPAQAGEGVQPAGAAPGAQSTVPPEMQAMWAAAQATEQAGTVQAPVGVDRFRADLAALKGKGFDAVMEALQGVVIPA